MKFLIYITVVRFVEEKELKTVTKNELMQLRFIENEIKLLKETLDRYDYDLSLQSPCLEFRGRGSHVSDKTAKLAETISDTKSKLCEMIEKMETLKNRVVCFIDGVDDSLVRQIIILRYVKGLSWAAVAFKTGGYNSPDNLRMMLDRFLKNSSRINSN